MSRLRRFIAGAVCPRCGKIDKLFVHDEGGHRLCECVACGFRDALDRTGEATPGAPRDPDEPQPLRLVDT